MPVALFSRGIGEVAPPLRDQPVDEFVVLVQGGVHQPCLWESVDPVTPGAYSQFPLSITGADCVILRRFPDEQARKFGKCTRSATWNRQATTPSIAAWPGYKTPRRDRTDGCRYRN